VGQVRPRAEIERVERDDGHRHDGGAAPRTPRAHHRHALERGEIPPVASTLTVIVSERESTPCSYLRASIVQCRRTANGRRPFVASSQSEDIAEAGSVQGMDATVVRRRALYEERAGVC